MAKQNTIQNNPEPIDLREEINKYLKYWPWFVVAIIICLALAFLHLRTTTPIYTTSSTIILGGKNQSPEAAAFADLGLVETGANGVEEEIGILRSRRLMNNVVEALDLEVQYFKEGDLKNILEGNVNEEELYRQSPLIVEVLQQDHTPGHAFRITTMGNDQLRITNTETEKVVTARMGDPVNLGFGDVVVSRNDNGLQEVKSILVKFSSVAGMAGRYRGGLQVTQSGNSSSIVELRLQDPVREKARDILDQLVLEYNRDAIEERSMLARSTAQFIGERLEIINVELDSVETGIEEFKEANDVVNMESQSTMYVQNVNEYSQRREELAIQMELTNAMIEHLRTASPSDLLPANLGIAETGVNSQIDGYNQLVLERNRILRGSTEQNPVVIRLNSQIAELKANIMATLERLRSNLRIAQEDINRQIASLGGKISAVPSQERQFRGIERQQNIKEALYLFLLQKREESSISLEVTAPKAKVVDRAHSGGIVSPNSNSIYTGAFLAGLLLPFMIIYSKNVLNNKVENKSDIEKRTQNIPVVGEIPRLKGNQKDVIEENDRSILAESFRIIITNLQYLLVNAGNKSRGVTLFVTSTVKGEGKTFTAFNLAITLANTDKKVLIIGADLRNPQLQRYERDSRNNAGVSDYLINNDLSIQNLIIPSALHNNLSLLSSGSIPPNPSELWRRDKVPGLFYDLQELFDYVIVDTAPVMPVADTFLINKYADLTLYVVRAGFTEKKLLNFAADAKNDGKLHDVSFILNDVESSNLGYYGNKYGYVYGEDKKKKRFWRK